MRQPPLDSNPDLVKSSQVQVTTVPEFNPFRLNKRITFSLQSRMIALFSCMLVIVLSTVNLARTYGIPFTRLAGGEYGLRTAEVFSNLKMVADLKLATLENWLTERGQDADTLSASRLMRDSIFAIHNSIKPLLTQLDKPNELIVPLELQQSAGYQLLLADLQAFRQTYESSYESIQLVDASTGIVILSTQSSEVGISLPADRLAKINKTAGLRQVIGLEQIEAANTQATYHSPPHFFISRYIQSLSNNENLAILVINVRPDALIKSFRGTNTLGESVKTYLITSDMSVLASSESYLPNQEKVSNLFSQALTDKLDLLAHQAKNELLQGTNAENQELLVVYRTIPTTQWGLVITVEQQEVFAQLRQSIHYSFWFGNFISLILGIGGTWFVIRLLSQPLVQLSNTIQKVQEGDLSARTSVRTNDEVGMLADMFNSMLDQLHESKIELERIIEERTNALRHANLHLEMTLDDMKQLNSDLEREVAERKRAEKIIRQKQLEQQIIFDSVPACIWYKDTHNHLIWTNKAATELNDLLPPVENIAENTPLEQLPPAASFESVYQEDLEVIHTGKPKLGLSRCLQTQDGRTLWMETDKVPFINEHGEVTGVVVLGTDTSARVEAERAVSESEQRFRAIFDSAVDGIVMIDRNGQIQMANPALARIFGYDLSELLGKSITTLMPSPYKDEHSQYINRYLHTQERHIVGIGRELVGLRKNGEIFPIYLAVNELRLQDTPMFTGIISDITELKRTQQALEQSKQELETQNRAYSRFVPREFLGFLGKESIVDVELGDQVQKEMSIMFSDIREFTRLSEAMTPRENFLFINDYLSKMEPVILERGGFIDKYIGDAIMALFPLSPDHAVQAAIEMLKTLHSYNEELAEAGKTTIEIGIGIHTGSMMLGTIGGQNRMDGTVISDAVNLASRMEGLTKMYGATLLITEHTFNRLEEINKYTIRVIDRVRVKGKQEPVIVFEVLDGYQPEILAAKVATLELFMFGVQAYQRRQFEEAEQAFLECLSINPSDRASQIYLRRSQLRQHHDSDENWDGITELSSKESLVL